MKTFQRYKQNKPTSITHQTLSSSSNITIIPETPTEKLQQQQNEELIDFLSPSLVSKTILTNSTPQPVHTSTPNKQNDIEELLELHQLKIQPQQQHLTKAKKWLTI